MLKKTQINCKINGIFMSMESMRKRYPALAVTVMMLLVLLLQGCATQKLFYYGFSDSEQRNEWGEVHIKTSCHQREIDFDKICGSPYDIGIRFYSYKKISDGTLSITKLIIKDTGGNIAYESGEVLSESVWTLAYEQSDGPILHSMSAITLTGLNLKHIDHKILIEFDITGKNITIRDNVEYKLEKKYIEDSEGSILWNTLQSV